MEIHIFSVWAHAQSENALFLKLTLSRSVITAQINLHFSHFTNNSSPFIEHNYIKKIGIII